MTPLDRLRTTLTGLSLTAIDARLEALLEAASKKEPSYADFLLEVMSAEADARSVCTITKTSDTQRGISYQAFTRGVLHHL